MDALPTADDVADAAARIAGHAFRTPLLRNPRLDAATGATVHLKPENMQRIGAFKFRGAYNALSRLPGDVRAAGILAASSGNHAQGVAEAARLLGVPATIVMPHDAPLVKVAGVKRAGGQIITYDRAHEDRQTVSQRVHDAQGGIFIHPFDNPDVIAGQGTVGREVADDMAATNADVDVVVVPCGGGGLTAGICLSIHDRYPKAAIYAVEPEAFDDTARSFRSGVREVNAHAAGSVCDSLLSPQPGEITFAINHAHLADVVTVSDTDACAAVAFAWDALKTVVEPGGAVALAAVLGGKIPVAGRTVVIVLSGGNVDAELFAEILAAPRHFNA